MITGGEEPQKGKALSRERRPRPRRNDTPECRQARIQRQKWWRETGRLKHTGGGTVKAGPSPRAADPREEKVQESIGWARGVTPDRS